MQLQAFHTLVTQFINRKDVTPDQVTFFINTALREFELRQNLNFNRRSALVTYPSSPGVGVALSGSSGLNTPPPDASISYEFRSLDGDFAVGLIGTNGVEVPLIGDTAVNVQRRKRTNIPLSETF